MNNLDGSLASLAVEINALHASAKGTQVAMGLKLIEVRKLLAMRNGERACGKCGADGLRPIGWGEWVRENLTCSDKHAYSLVNIALNPEYELGRKAKEQSRRRRSASFLIGNIRRIWKLLDEADRNRVIDEMISLSEGGA